MAMRWVALAVFLPSLWALDAPKARAAPEDKVTARTFFVAGKKLFSAGRYREAIEALTKAQKYWKHHVILFNIAYCHARLGETLAAGTYLHQFLERASDKERQLPPELEAIRRATGILTIEAPRDDLRLFVNGEPVGRGRVRLVALAGRKVLELRKNDRVLARQVVFLPGTETRSWAPGPETLSRLEPGPKRVSRPVSALPRAIAAPMGRPDESRGKVHWGYFAATTGLALALAGAATGLGLHAKSLVDDYRRANALGLATEAQRSRAIGTMIGVNALWGAAGAAAITASILAIFTRWRPAERVESRLRITPGPGSGPLGLGFQVEY